LHRTLQTTQPRCRHETERHRRPSRRAGLHPQQEVQVRLRQAQARRHGRRLRLRRRITLENCRLDLQTPKLAARLDVDHAELFRLRSWLGETPGRLRFSGRLDGSPITIDARLEPFAKVPRFDGHLAVDGLDLARFLDLARPAVDRLAGSLTLDTDIDLRLIAGGVALTQDGKVRIDAPDIADAGGQARLARVAWDGQLDAAFGATRADAVHLKGALDVGSGRVNRQQGPLKLALDDLHWQGRAAVTRAAGDDRWQVAQDGQLRLKAPTVAYAAIKASAAQLGWHGAVNHPGADVELSGKLNGSGLAVADGNGLDAHLADVAWDGELKAVPKPDGMHLTQKARLQLKGLDVTHPAATVRENDIAWNGKLGLTTAKQLSLDADGRLQAKGKGHTDAGDVGVDHGDVDWQGRVAVDAGKVSHLDGRFTVAAPTVVRDGATLLAARSLTLDKLRGKAGVVGAGVVEARQVTLLDSKSAKVAPLLKAARLQVAGVGVEPGKRIDLGEVTLRDSVSNLHRTAKGQWQQLAPLRSGSKAGEAKKTTSGAGNGGPAIALAGLVLAGKNQLVFHDESVKPVYHADIAIDTLKVGAADSRKPNAATPVAFAGRVGDYGKISLSGDVKPFAAQTTLHLSGGIENFDLPPLSGYTTRELGYDLTSGHLTAGLHINIDAGKLSGDNALKFNQLQVAPSDPERMAELSKQLSMPLDSALSLLRDDEDNIKIHVPLGGDLSSPEFGYADAINQALGKAMKTTALTFLKYYFQPYGALITVAELANKAMAIRLDPLAFAPGSSALDANAVNYLDKVGGLMKARPKLRIRLCGKAVAADAAALKQAKAPPPPKESDKTSGDGKTKPLTEKERLEALAKARAVGIRDFLVKKFAVDPGRLFVCLPEAQPDDKEKPRVELLI